MQRSAPRERSAVRHLRQVQEEGRLPENPAGGDLVDPLLVLVLVLVMLVVAMVVEMFVVGGGGGARKAGRVRQHESLHHAALDEVHLRHGTPR